MIIFCSSLGLHYICKVFGNTKYKTFENICSIALESPPRNRHEQTNTQLSLYQTGADIAIVYLACGEPESVGEGLRFSFFS